MDRSLSDIERDGDGGASAQTAVELYEQLQRQGYGGDDLGTIRAAVGVAVRLYSGLNSEAGKPHLAHCIGVASGLAAARMPAEVVAAGVVHSAYFQGDFGPWRVFRRQKRQRLRQLLGAAIDELVARFTSFAWSPDAIVALPGRVDALDALDRRVVVMWLANEADSLRHGEALFGPEGERLRAEALRKRPAVIAIAEKLDVPGLGRALAEGVDAMQRVEVPAALRLPSVRVVPGSAHPRLEAIVMRHAAEALRRLRRSV